MRFGLFRRYFGGFVSDSARKARNRARIHRGTRINPIKLQLFAVLFSIFIWDFGLGWLAEAGKRRVVSGGEREGDKWREAAEGCHVG